ncbi:hypothetical protein LEP1GSC163_2772 [Leptospira santarosai str. CBC379]|uniref:Uncharacterized protein n=1 Tax=Leptospira santarosai str. MOR084 TaxID=1049984 RepID=A0A0E2BFP0_9LEPT|nr:hypothetical protein [Leptospira santarosai]EKO33746.1 hypothetical protein LEP1GSC179_2456 [Leptospira santarosai str. MOR084]EKR92057.1 hypothetical protein LEP1GSC163_2772 [Leptospira santarosai str. CBC379]
MVASGVQSSNIWEDDVLNRERIALFLENILKQKSGNYVLTINSPWGIFNRKNDQRFEGYKSMYIFQCVGGGFLKLCFPFIYIRHSK